ncbi:MAG: hypothetical protein MHM6MM_002372 [Cercozoa sp. M6MM]
MSFFGLFRGRSKDEPRDNPQDAGNAKAETTGARDLSPQQPDRLPQDGSPTVDKDKMLVDDGETQESTLAESEKQEFGLKRERNESALAGQRSDEASESSEGRVETGETAVGKNVIAVEKDESSVESSESSIAKDESSIAKGESEQEANESEQEASESDNDMTQPIDDSAEQSEASEVAAIDDGDDDDEDDEGDEAENAPKQKTDAVETLRRTQRRIKRRRLRTIGTMKPLRRLRSKVVPERSILPVRTGYEAQHWLNQYFEDIGEAQMHLLEPKLPSLPLSLLCNEEGSVPPVARSELFSCKVSVGIPDPSDKEPLLALQHEPSPLGLRRSMDPKPCDLCRDSKVRAQCQVTPSGACQRCVSRGVRCSLQAKVYEPDDHFDKSKERAPKFEETALFLAPFALSVRTGCHQQVEAFAKQASQQATQAFSQARVTSFASNELLAGRIAADEAFDDDVDWHEILRVSALFEMRLDLDDNEQAELDLAQIDAEFETLLAEIDALESRDEALEESTAATSTASVVGVDEHSQEKLERLYDFVTTKATSQIVAAEANARVFDESKSLHTQLFDGGAIDVGFLMSETEGSPTDGSLTSGSPTDGSQVIDVDVHIVDTEETIVDSAAIALLKRRPDVARRVQDGFLSSDAPKLCPRDEVWLELRQMQAELQALTEEGDRIRAEVRERVREFQKNERIENEKRRSESHYLEGRLLDPQAWHTPQLLELVAKARKLHSRSYNRDSEQKRARSRRTEQRQSQHAQQRRERNKHIEQLRRWTGGAFTDDEDDLPQDWPSEQDACCAVCLSPHCDVNDGDMVFCEGCEIAVHQRCYGIPALPEGDFFCERCQFYRVKREPKECDFRCRVCPHTSGAMKPAEGGGFVHVLCANSVPELHYGNDTTMSPVQGLSLITKDRRNMRCQLCKKGGAELRGHSAIVQCAKARCATAFHITCARRAGLPVLEVSGSEADVALLNSLLSVTELEKLADYTFVGFCRRCAGDYVRRPEHVPRDRPFPKQLLLKWLQNNNKIEKESASMARLVARNLKRERDSLVLKYLCEGEGGARDKSHLLQGRQPQRPELTQWVHAVCAHFLGPPWGEHREVGGVPFVAGLVHHKNSVRCRLCGRAGGVLTRCQCKQMVVHAACGLAADFPRSYEEGKLWCHECDPLKKRPRACAESISVTASESSLVLRVPRAVRRLLHGERARADLRVIDPSAPVVGTVTVTQNREWCVQRLRAVPRVSLTERPSDAESHMELIEETDSLNDMLPVTGRAVRARRRQSSNL